jgi:hypothetical protein
MGAPRDFRVAAGGRVSHAGRRPDRGRAGAGVSPGKPHLRRCADGDRGGGVIRALVNNQRQPTGSSSIGDESTPPRQARLRCGFRDLAIGRAACAGPPAIRAPSGV